ncbi:MULTISPECIES: hypothetical protein [Chryseobacterium]|uniref:Histidine kinase n=1 Tax=Chryseobacterium caseinilyticum TaxID=2771428 RepID=A0ABR8Z9V4_9FLAO|nr:MULTISPECIES: hypothetical protein [Chryseobacterium]KQS92965.1 hypothetical protein ASG21_11165 [Chryseobacterium sp. Leaf394]MBD8082084.1 hypothetical protein [Chryseobacterium caseinilyticum]
MQKFYKVFLVIFIVFTAINVYAIDWNLKLTEEDNSKFVFSAIAGILGIAVIFVLNTWSKISVKK